VKRTEVITGAVLILIGVVALVEIMLTPGEQSFAAVLSGAAIGLGLSMLRSGLSPWWRNRSKRDA
jgi:hypothetical protein